MIHQPWYQALNLDRVELADITGGPAAMAAGVHRQLGALSNAVPIDAIAMSLDITEIRKDSFDGFEGMLLTDRRRSFGKILANTRDNVRRARFSIAHELGHFLLESHELNRAEGFGCNRADMNERSAGTRQQKQEAEANRFAIDLLAPAYRLKSHLACPPDLQSVEALHRELDISLEAAARRFIELHDEPLAVVMTKDRVVRYAERNDRFPKLKILRGNTIPSATRAHRLIAAGTTGVTGVDDTYAAA